MASRRRLAWLGVRMGGGAFENVQARRQQEARRAEAREAVARYASERLPGRLGAQGPPVSLRAPSLGMRSIVHLVDFEGFPRIVLRVLRRWLRAARLAYNFRAFARTGLPVPRLLDSDLSPLTRVRWGFYALSEEFVEGQHPTEAADREAAVRAVARALARFHNVERRRWGWPAFPRPGSYRRHVLERVAERAGHLARALPQGQPDALVAWFRLHAGTAALDAPFALTHSRVNRGNFIVRPDGEAIVVDLIECRYGTFCPDLVSALHRLCECEERLTGAFLDEYFATRPARCRAAFEQSRTFFEASHELGQASSNTRRVGRALDADEAAAFRACLAEHVERLAELTGVELTLAEP